MASTAASAASLSPLPAARGGDGGGFGHANHLEREVAIGRDNDAAKAVSSSAPRLRSAAARWRARIFLSDLTRCTLARISSALSSGRVSARGSARAGASRERDD